MSRKKLIHTFIFIQFMYFFRPKEPHLQESLFSDTEECLQTRSIGCSDGTAKLCECVENRILLLVKMLSELFSEDEDPWALRQHQGDCCYNFIIRFFEIN